MPASRTTNSGPVVRRVPAVGAATGSVASAPARASTRAMGMKRPHSIAPPIDAVNQDPDAVRPPKAEPLLLAPEVKA